MAEIAELVESTGATGIVCDDELSPAQQKNLETYLDTKVMDRTLVILDIFASRATTSEGKIQVEFVGTGKVHVEAWRWNRNKRSRREKA